LQDQCPWLAEAVRAQRGHEEIAVDVAIGNITAGAVADGRRGNGVPVSGGAVSERPG